jgi:predicted O-methyltransferase YrrM
MENLITEYFKFNGTQSKDVKIIDELNPNKILRENIPKFIDTNLYKDKVDENLYNKKFNIDYDLYAKIIGDNKFGEYINGNYLKIKTIEFVNEHMVINKMPIVSQFNSVIYKLYKTYKIYDELNNEYPFKSGIKQDYGIFLYNMIIKNKMTKTLEIGFANGSSGLFITSALRNLELYGHKTYHVAVDPNQSTQWKNIGALHIKKLGYNNIEIIEKPDYIALPDLLKERVKNTKWLESKYDTNYEKFDMIFIDGWHTFDYTLLDFFYADLLLKVGGYIVVDDAKFDALKELDKYLNSNFKFYKKESYEMGLWMVYKKIRDDDRSWDFHVNFTQGNRH